MRPVVLEERQEGDLEDAFSDHSTIKSVVYIALYYILSADFFFTASITSHSSRPRVSLLLIENLRGFEVVCAAAQTAERRHL